MNSAKTEVEWLVGRKGENGQWLNSWSSWNEAESRELYDVWVKRFGKDQVRMMIRTTTITTEERVIE